MSFDTAGQKELQSLRLRLGPRSSVSKGRKLSIDSFSLSFRVSMTEYIIWSCELTTMSFEYGSNAQVVDPPENEWVCISSVLVTAMPKSDGLCRRD